MGRKLLSSGMVRTLHVEVDPNFLAMQCCGRRMLGLLLTRIPGMNVTKEPPAARGVEEAFVARTWNLQRMTKWMGRQFYESHARFAHTVDPWESAEGCKQKLK